MDDATFLRYFDRVVAARTIPALLAIAIEVDRLYPGNLIAERIVMLAVLRAEVLTERGVRRP